MGNVFAFVDLLQVLLVMWYFQIKPTPFIPPHEPPPRLFSSLYKPLLNQVS